MQRLRETVLGRVSMKNSSEQVLEDSRPSVFSESSQRPFDGGAAISLAPPRKRQQQPLGDQKPQQQQHDDVLIVGEVVGGKGHSKSGGAQINADGFPTATSYDGLCRKVSRRNGYFQI